jgi:hypothetical protein
MLIFQKLINNSLLKSFVKLIFDINFTFRCFLHRVQVEATNTGLLLHHQSHVDRRYKRSLITIMLNHAF